MQLTELNLSRNVLDDTAANALGEVDACIFILAPTRVPRAQWCSMAGPLSALIAQDPPLLHPMPSAQSCPLQMLKQNNSIKILNLNWCGLRQSGAFTLVDALKSNSALQSLDLGWNGLTDKVPYPPYVAELSCAVGWAGYKSPAEVHHNTRQRLFNDIGSVFQPHLREGH